MRAQRTALLCLIAALTFASADHALAQKNLSRGPSSEVGRPMGPAGGGGGGGLRGGGFGGLGAVVPGIIMAVPQGHPPNGPIIDAGPPGPHRGQQANRRGGSGAPPASERRLVPDEVVIELSNSVSTQQVEALQRRFNLTRIESQAFQLSNTTLYRWRIPDRRSVATVVRALEGDRLVASAQPNYLFTLQENEKSEGDPAQYEVTKLRLPEAHTLARGDRVLIAVIDSGIDVNHPELAGSIGETFDALAIPGSPHKHGTAIAGLIAAHARLVGAAPDAKILAVRAFDAKDNSAQSTTFNILKGIDWAATHGARVINMSFAGPSDPAIHRALDAAHKKGIVLVAAAGNAGAKSPPLYPAADPNVIAVSATDADDKLFEQSNRGRHITVAAPGAQILVAAPDSGYDVSSGTSFSAAEVSGIVALMIQRRPGLTPDQVRGILRATAKDLGPKGPDEMFGAGLVDAYGALTAEKAPPTAAGRPIERVSNGAR
jgi:hypothetical protein